MSINYKAIIIALLEKIPRSLRGMRILFIGIILCFSVNCWGEGAQNDTTPAKESDAIRVNPSVDANEGKTASVAAQADAVFADIKLKADTAFGQTPTAMKEQTAKRSYGQFSEWTEKMKAYNGVDPNELRAQGQWGKGQLYTGTRSSPRGYSEHQHIGGVSRLAIISAEEVNTHDIDKYKGKLQKALGGTDAGHACGSFDWVMQLKAKFNSGALEKYLDQIGETAMAAAPMAFLANWSPTLYEIVKFLRGIASGELNADNITCASMENALTGVGQRMLRGPGYAKCIKANASLGTTEAHKLCNGAGNGAFDGLENVAGKIVGFAGQIKNLNFTKFMQKKIGGAAPEDAVAHQWAIENQVKAQEVYDAALADLANHTVGSPNYRQAQVEIEAAKYDLGNAINGQKNTESIWSGFRNGLAENLPGIIGNLNFDAKIDLQLGNTNQKMVILDYSMRSFVIKEAFAEALDLHYHIMFESDHNAADIRESYAQLMIFCWNSMQQPWIAYNYNMPGFKASDSKLDYETLDKLAYLHHAIKRAGPNSVVRRLDEEHSVTLAISTIAEFEMWDYVKDGLDASETDVMTNVKDHSTMKSEEAKPVIALIEKRLKEWRENVELKHSGLSTHVMLGLEGVNKFRIPAGNVQYSESQRTFTNRFDATPDVGR